MKPRVRVISAAFIGVAIITACLAVPHDARAAWLTGGSAGLSKTYKYSVGGEVSQLDSTGVAFRLSGGYTIMRNLGVLVSYVDLGKLTASGPAFGGFTDSIEARAEDFSMMGILPVGSRIGFFASMGLFVWQQKVDYSDQDGDFHYNDNGLSFSYGLGANVDITPAHTLGLHVEWQRFTGVGDRNNSGHRMTRDVFSAGLVYRFPH